MDTTKESPTVLSLCTGLLRGLERGVEAALGNNIRFAAYVETEAFCIENLICGMEASVLDAAPIWTDVKTFPWRSFYKKIFAIIGGYPCQPFSMAGDRRGTDDPRHLWPYFKKGVRAIKPKLCFFENVPGHISLGLKEVKEDLEGMGYRVEAGIFSAEEIGGTQLRKRLFIMAIHDSISRPRRYSHICSKKKANERKTQKWKWSRGKLVTKNKTLVHSFSQGLEGSARRNALKEEIEIFKRRVTSRTTKEGFPAGFGKPRYEWEEPQEIEFGMGCTINGHNIEEHIIRGLGNGVVWQTAELAFRTLLKKHLNGSTNTK